MTKYKPKLGELQSEHWAPTGLDEGYPIIYDDIPKQAPKQSTRELDKQIRDWDWDPRKGPDPKVKQFVHEEWIPPSPFPDPRDPPISHTMRGVVVSEREHLLREGAEITGGPRNAEYGDPIDNLTMTGKLKEVFHSHMQRPMGPAEKEAIDMVLTKLGRLGRGTIKRDTYMDAAVYMAIAYEVAVIEQIAPQLED